MRWWQRKPIVIAVDPTGRWAYLGGLGGQGIGEMWCPTRNSPGDGPIDYSSAPIRIPQPGEMGYERTLEDGYLVN